jgi:molybdopterin/thiamine biosynthesis adenylyltransferase
MKHDLELLYKQSCTCYGSIVLQMIVMCKFGCIVVVYDFMCKRLCNLQQQHLYISSHATNTT